jgi:outer membrane biosynthesis protein TonB
MWSSRVAAVLVLTLAIYFYIDESGENIVNPSQVAVVEPETTGNNADAEATPPPTEAEKKQADPTEIIPKTKSKTPVKTKKEEAVPKTTKSLRETTKGRMDHKKIAETRTPIEVPEKIGSLSASIQTSRPQNMALASMTVTIPENVNYTEDEVFFAEVVKEKTGLDNFSFRKITKAGLNLVTNISKDKFSYQTNQEGEITELNYDSRLLAFSIPTNNEPVAGE